MDAVKFLEEYKRMCNNYEKCKGCPISTCKLADGTFFCNSFIKWHAEKAVTLVEKWSKEHPQKTILDDFKEKYPNAPFCDGGNPKYVCPYHVGYDDSTPIYVCPYHVGYDEEQPDCGAVECVDCWNRPLEEVTK